MFNNAQVYDIIYALAASNGRQAALFGDCAPLAHEAFARTCMDSEFPVLWFEIPLKGKPWFDLHVPAPHSKPKTDASAASSDAVVSNDVLEWYETNPGTKRLMISYDVSRGDIEHPAVQLLVRDPSVHEPFLEMVGGKDAAAAYHAFAQRLPDGWFPCYSGIFPDRPNIDVRVECIPHHDLQVAYANDVSLLESRLRQVGLTEFGDTVMPRCQVLADTPFLFELQFNVRADGSLDETLGVSLRFGSPAGTDGYEVFDPNGAAGKLCKQLEDWGLADDRWRLLADTVYAKRIRLGDQSVVAGFYPDFIKLRWRKGKPLDAKAYLVAIVQ